MGDIQAVLFDNDGTLVDTHELILSSFQHCTQAVLGWTITPERLRATGGKPLVEQMRELTDDPTQQEALLQAYLEHNHAHHDDAISLFPGVAEGLARLRKAGLSCGIVTSKRHALAWHGLELTGISQYFGSCIAADDCEKFKPDPAPVLLAAGELGADARACAFVGDSPLDVQAGNAAGCTTFAALWGMFEERDVRASSPDFACRSFDELVEAILARR